MRRLFLKFSEKRYFLIISLIFVFVIYELVLTALLIRTLDKNKETINQIKNFQEKILGAINFNSDSQVSDEYEVMAVVDGDTIKIRYGGTVESVRLIGIDTPEKDECFNHEATYKIKQLVEGKYVKIEFDNSQGERDRYDRLLLYIWEDGILVNDVMIREGYAFEYTYNLPYKYMEQFKQAQTEALENSKGLWSGVCD